MAAIVGICKAFFEILMGVIGFFADEVSDPSSAAASSSSASSSSPRRCCCCAATPIGYWITVRCPRSAQRSRSCVRSRAERVPRAGLVSAATNLAVIWLLFRPAAREYVSSAGSAPLSRAGPSGTCPASEALSTAAACARARSCGCAGRDTSARWARRPCATCRGLAGHGWSEHMFLSNCNSCKALVTCRQMR